MTPTLRQQLETALDFISRAALGHDTGHCVHLANKAEAEIRGAIDALNVLLAESEVLKAGKRMKSFGFAWLQKWLKCSPLSCGRPNERAPSDFQR